MDDRIPFTEEQPVLYVNNAPFHLWMLDLQEMILVKWSRISYVARDDYGITTSWQRSSCRSATSTASRWDL